MREDISRRDMMKAIGIGAAAIAAAELGVASPARAEDAFTIASTGGSWGEGLKQAYVVNSSFEKRANTQVSYAHMTLWWAWYAQRSWSASAATRFPSGHGAKLLAR